jgi:hypothetical protein
MKTIAHSIIAKRFGAMLAIGLAAAVLSGSITPAAAHKSHGGGKHGQHGQHQPKPPMPLPAQPMPLPPKPVVHDHRVPKPVVVRDHRATPVVRDHRARVARGSRARTTTVKIAGQKVVTVTTKGKRCVAGVCF